jgi:uncharacterized protein YecE (DUF72 family)
MRQLRVGISGWTYPPWRGKFYPAKLQQKRELEFAARQFNSIEINGTFYSMQTPSSFETWYEQTPNDFVFAIKGSRFITHMKKLKDVEKAAANFFASGVLRLREKLGPILWQFPERMPYEPDRFEEFLQILPRDFKQAVKLGRKHDDRLKSRAYLRVDENREIRHAFELRNPQFMCSEFVNLLRRHNAALVFADTAQKWPYCEEVTADFIYIRLHGSKELYASGYGEKELRWWAERVNVWARGKEPSDAHRVSHEDVAAQNRRRRARAVAERDVYVYFDNDAKVFAPFNAIRLSEMLGILEPRSAERHTMRSSSRSSQRESLVD